MRVTYVAYKRFEIWFILFMVKTIALMNDSFWIFNTCFDVLI